MTGGRAEEAARTPALSRSPGEPVYLSVIIPGYNESGNIRSVVSEALETLERSGVPSFELILVDDGSTDSTRAAMNALAVESPRVRAFSHVRNLGVGAALRTGIDSAEGDFVTWIPGDGQFDLAGVLSGLPQLATKDIVIVLREGRKAAARGLISLCFHTMIRLLFRFDATDMCGIFLARRDMLKDLRPTSTNIFLTLEIPLLCVRRQKSLGRIRASVRPRLGGTSKVANLRTMALNFYEVLKFRAGL